MSLANEAAKVLSSAIRLLQKELGPKFSQVGEVDALFTWEGQDYRVSLQPYSEDPPSPQKATRKDFQHEPMPDTKEELLLDPREAF
jgi:hypothetical protein